jgi:hypothetical protein
MKHALNINENFISRIWEGGSKYYKNLLTASGEQLTVIDFGTKNYDSGPDYLNAKIKIDGKLLIGDVEIHRDFKNWHQHKHHKDPRYNSVILHIVLWETNSKINTKPRIKRKIPAVILSHFLTKPVSEIWQDIISNPSKKFKLPCYDFNDTFPMQELLEWFNKLAIMRLELKSKAIEDRLNELADNKNNFSLNSKAVWEQALYEFIFEALGYEKNKNQMKLLASTLRLDEISKIYEKKLINIQALLYYYSGLLFDLRYKDSYIKYIKEFASKHNLTNVSKLEPSQWIFFRLRPMNFPTLRIAFGSQIVFRILNENFFKNIIDLFQKNFINTSILYTSLLNLFNPSKDDYWNFHYHFGKLSKSNKALIGKQRISDIIINVIIPFVYNYSIIFNNKIIKENVLLLYNGLKIKPDNNIIRVISTQLIKLKKIKINTPALEQASVQLYNFYCTREKCHKCEVGKHSINTKGFDFKIIYY